MDEAEIVATIAAGELDGLTAALDRYAVPLFEYCHAMAPEAAVDAVHDTFIIAWCKLGGLRDPGRLGGWLETVAGNECFRHGLTSDTGDISDTVDFGDTIGTGPPSVMPPGLPGRVLSECADETPGGRALRVWVTNRAGPFGGDGFPKTHLAPRRHLAGFRPGGHRRVGVAAAAALVLAAAGTAVALVSSGGPRHDAASATEPGTGASTGAAPTQGASLPVTPATQIPSTHANKAPRTSPASPTGTVSPGPMAPVARTGPAQQPPVVMVATLPPSAPAPPPPATSPPATQPAPGMLTVSPPQLTLVMGGAAPAKNLLLTAQNGPVTGYTIEVPPNLPGMLSVSPSSGSLAAGASARITVSAASKVSFTTDLTIYPGDIQVQVTVKANKASNS